MPRNILSFVDAIFQGYRTGYVYHDGLNRRDPRKDRINNEIEVPPSSSNVNYFYDDMNKYV